MLKRLPVHTYVRIGEIIHEMETLLTMVETAKSYGHDDEHALLDESEKRQLKASVKILHGICVQNDLQGPKALLATRLDDPPQTKRELELLATAVKTGLQDELYLSVPRDKAKFYEADDLLTEPAREAFPTAHDELREAGNCFALGRNTASVIHSMRAAEIGLWALANYLQVTFPNYPNEYAQWLALINQCEAKIRQKQNQTRGPQKDEDLQFYSDAAMHFLCFKDAWRTRAAHARASFDESRAAKVLRHTQEFFESLAERLKE